MTIVGFNPAVARANGDPTRPTGSDVSAQGRVFGNCGSPMWTCMTWARGDTHGHRLRPRIGGGLSTSGRSVSGITAPRYAKTWKYSGPLFFRTTWTNFPYGYDAIPFAAYASPFVTTGTATLVNGVVCASGQPTDLEAI